jgi:hypothetical protein
MHYSDSKKISIFIAKDIIGDFLYWPIWWYTVGAFKLLIICVNELKNQVATLGLTIWIGNLFTPMFGQYDFEGRIISFFIRLIQIILRSIVLLLWVAIMGLIFLTWLVTPVLVLYKIYSYFL